MGQTSIATPGAVINGRYRLVRELGKGAMGVVWLAHHVSLRVPVAIKFVDDRLSRQPDFLDRFEQEARAAAQIRSPNVVKVTDFGTDEAGRPFLIMEYLEGATLGAYLAQHGRMDLPRAVRVIRDACRGLGHAHAAGIVHRDVKPENLFLSDDGEQGLVARLLDFGVARPVSGSVTATAADQLVGSPAYMSPEQARSLPLDRRTDLFSLGVVAYVCFTGKNPFKAPSLHDTLVAVCSHIPEPVTRHVPELPPALDPWFARALAKQPEYRFTSAREMAHAFRQAIGDVARASEVPLSLSLQSGARVVAPRSSPPSDLQATAPSADGEATRVEGVPSRVEVLSASAAADAGSVDAGSADAGSADAGLAQAGSAQAGSADAGSADAGSAQATGGGPLPSAGSPSVGSVAEGSLASTAAGSPASGSNPTLGSSGGPDAQAAKIADTLELLVRVPHVFGASLVAPDGRVLLARGRGALAAHLRSFERARDVAETWQSVPLGGEASRLICRTRDVTAYVRWFAGSSLVVLGDAQLRPLLLTVGANRLSAQLASFALPLDAPGSGQEALMRWGTSLQELAPGPPAHSTMPGSTSSTVPGGRVPGGTEPGGTEPGGTEPGGTGGAAPGPTDPGAAAQGLTAAGALLPEAAAGAPASRVGAPGGPIPSRRASGRSRKRLYRGRVYDEPASATPPAAAPAPAPPSPVPDIREGTVPLDEGQLARVASGVPGLWRLLLLDTDGVLHGEAPGTPADASVGSGAQAEAAAAAGEDAVVLAATVAVAHAQLVDLAAHMGQQDPRLGVEGSRSAPALSGSPPGDSGVIIGGDAWPRCWCLASSSGNLYAWSQGTDGSRLLIAIGPADGQPSRWMERIEAALR